MKLLIIGAAGVGTSAAMIIKNQGKDGEWVEKNEQKLLKGIVKA